jgi:hypothetical protein
MIPCLIFISHRPGKISCTSIKKSSFEDVTTRTRRGWNNGLGTSVTMADINGDGFSHICFAIREMYGK